MKEAKIDTIYSPETGRVACVLIQAAFECDQRVANLFNTEDWDTTPNNKMQRLSAPLDVWQKIASMSREERINSFHNSQYRNNK